MFARLRWHQAGRMPQLVLFSMVMALTATLAYAADPSTVKLVVDYGDGAEVHLTSLPWKEGMNVLDVLTAAKAHKHGITFAQRGSGSTAMITKIGDLENEGGRGKNWIFSVGDKVSEVGAGATTVSAGDVILWKFRPFDYN